MVIILGIIMFVAFYKLCLSWYVGNVTKGELYRPVIFFKPWFFPTISIVSLVLLSASIACFWAASPWLTVIPIGVLIVSTYWIRLKRGAQLDKVIRVAVDCHYEMSAQGANQPTINREIVRRTLGNEEASRDWMSDVDVRTLLMANILPSLGLYNLEVDAQRGLSQREQIDALFDSYAKLKKAILANLAKA